MKQKEKRSLTRIKVFFGIYCLGMLWLLFDRTGAAEGVSYWDQVQKNLNLTPLHTIRNYWHVLTNRAYYTEKWGFASVYEYHARHAFLNLVGNVVMFVPLGYFLPRLFPRLRNLLVFLLAFLGLLAAVELTQLFTLLGSCDVDDLILNLAGAWIGWCGCLLWRREKKHGKPA